MEVDTLVNPDFLLSDVVKKLSKSATLALNQKVAELKRKNIEIINLGIGEPNFYVKDHIKNAAKKAVEDNYSFYSPVAGFDELREAIVEKMKRDYNLDYKKEQIVVSNGAKHSIMNVILATVNPGDEVIIPVPYWVSYPEMIKIANGKPVFIKTSFENKFKFTAEQLLNAITPKTKLLIYSSPSNPTGSVFTKKELSEFVNVLKDFKNILIVSDEIYELLNFTDEHISIANFEEVFDQVVIINGISKTYSMPGYRIGFMAGPEWLANAVIKLQSHMTSGPSSISQMAAIEAFKSSRAEVTEYRNTIMRLRDIAYELLLKIPYIKTNLPMGAFYFFVDISNYIGTSYLNYKINSDSDLCLYLLETAKVATVPGIEFGMPNYIRISFATNENILIEGINRIKEQLTKLS